MTAERNIYKTTAILLIVFKNLLDTYGNHMEQGIEFVVHLTLGLEGSVIFFCKYLN
jgi:hypothetical protein